MHTQDNRRGALSWLTYLSCALIRILVLSPHLTPLTFLFLSSVEASLGVPFKLKTAPRERLAGCDSQGAATDALVERRQVGGELAGDFGLGGETCLQLGVDLALGLHGLPLSISALHLGAVDLRLLLAVLHELDRRLHLLAVPDEEREVAHRHGLAVHAVVLELLLELVERVLVRLARAAEGGLQHSEDLDRELLAVHALHVAVHAVLEPDEHATRDQLDLVLGVRERDVPVLVGVEDPEEGDERLGDERLDHVHQVDVALGGAVEERVGELQAQIEAAVARHLAVVVLLVEGQLLEAELAAPPVRVDLLHVRAELRDDRAVDAAADAIGVLVRAGEGLVVE